MTKTQNTKPNHTATLTVLGYRRANASRNGNPAFFVLLGHDDGNFEARTITDGSVGWAIENFREGDLVDVTFTRAGRITNMVNR